MRLTCRSYSRENSSTDVMVIRCHACGKTLEGNLAGLRFLKPDPNKMSPEGTVFPSESLLWDFLVEQHEPNCKRL